MNSASEVVAIESAGGGRDVMKFRTNFKPKKNYKHYPYFVDPQIVPRVKQYLEDNKDKVYVDINEMVAELRRKYRDYGSKKRTAFKSIVEKAFSVVLQNYGMTDRDTQHDPESDSSDVSDMDADSEDLDLIVENQGNRQVVNMYLQKKRNNVASANSGGNKELIDISSDEEEVDVQTPSKRTKIGDSINCCDPKQPSIGREITADSQSADKQDTNGQREVALSSITPNNVAQNTSENVIPTASERPKRKRPIADVASISTNIVHEDNPRRRKWDVPVATPCKSFKDVGGYSKVLQEVCKLLVHIRHPEIFEQVGISPLRGFLLHGPPGCGKTLLANAIAGEIGVPLLKVAAPELVAGVSGESEERIRDLFEQALSLAPCVLFLDEIDAITPNRNNAQREMERRIVAQLLTCLDELGEKEGGNQVLVLGATNRPDSLDPALRRAGRFDREVCMGIPDREARAHILRVVCGRLALAPDVASENGIEQLAKLTPGFVGADLTALAREAAMSAVNRIFSDLSNQKSDETEKSKTENEGTSHVNDSSNDQLKDEDIAVSQNIDDKGVSGKAAQEVSEDVAVVEIEKEVQEVSVDEVAVVEVESVESEVKNTKDNLEHTETEKEQLEVEVLGNDLEVLITPGVNTCEEQKKDKVDVISSEATAHSSEKCDEIEIMPVPNETFDKSTTSEQDIEVIPPEVRGEKRKDDVDKDPFPNKKIKSASEVEVVEVEMIECNDKQSEHSTEPLATQNQETSEASEQVKPTEETSEASEQTSTKPMVLSQQLNPLSAWTPELCQLLSWLREKPILTPDQLSSLSVTMADFHEALHVVQPSAKREGFATVPDVTWEDVGSLSEVRSELQLAILAPVRYAEQFEKLGLNVPTGVLLCGPPGCGKTLLAKAIANEAGINFISVKGPELLNMYVGESERAVRQVFQRARNSAPCVIFFDEVDALCPKRSDSGDNGVSSRVVNQLLTEMDGVEGRSSVFLMAASNRPDIIDPAIMRPGRLDKILFVGFPSADDRVDILRALTKDGSRPQLAPDVDLTQMARFSSLEGYSGADLAALVREAGVQCLQEFIGSNSDPSTSICIAHRHFTSALAKMRPSVSEKDRKHYEKLQQTYTSKPQSSTAESMDTL